MDVIEMRDYEINVIRSFTVSAVMSALEMTLL